MKEITLEIDDKVLEIIEENGLEIIEDGGKSFLENNTGEDIEVPFEFPAK